MKPHHARKAQAPGLHRQRGVTMLFGLIALAIMMIGAAAMVRSMNSSLFSAGNLGFKRDLTNQAERAANAVMDLVNTGALNTEVARQSHNTGENYSATLLATNAQGIPTVLVNDSTFSTVGSSSKDITVSDQGVVARYVIDRLCTATGVADVTNCAMSDPGPSNGVVSSNLDGAEHAQAGGVSPIQRQVVYRLTVRVTGPRNTQAFFQTTFTI
jgi:type IV pilus assembly protein PilX